MIDVKYFQILLVVVCVLAIIAAVTVGTCSVNHARLRVFLRTLAVLLGSSAGVALVLLVLLK
jgi:hypothetical protein